jgi:cytochrome c-type biogenesis protein
MQRLFEVLTDAAQAGPGVALGAAFVWGVLSIVLSPCHLASIPLIIGFIDAQGRTTTRRAFTLALLFAIGILITIGLVGAVTAAAGRMMGDVGPAGVYAVAAVFLIIGLHLMDVLPLPLPGAMRVGMKRKGLAAALVLGLVFGIALGPCTFAYMAPVLTVVFAVATSQFTYGLLLLLAFGVGHCAVIVVAGTSTEVVQRYLTWNERSRGSVWLKRGCGALVVAGGLYMLYAAPG